MGGADEQECMEEVAAPKEREREERQKRILLLFTIICPCR